MASLGGSEFEIESRQSDAEKIGHLVSWLAMNDSETIPIQSEWKYGHVYLFSAMPTRRIN